MPEQFTRRADECPSRSWCWARWYCFGLQSLVQDALDGDVGQVAEAQRTCAGGFQPRVADCLTQLEDAHHARMAVEHLLVKQALHELCGGSPDLLCHRVAHLACPGELGQFLGR